MVNQSNEITSEGLAYSELCILFQNKTETS